MTKQLLTLTESKLLKCFDRPSMRIRIPRLAINKGKFPLIANWPNYYEKLTISQMLQAGYNWGIRTGKKIGNYYFAIIDLDDIWAKERISALRYVKTAKGIHVYCLIKEITPYLILVNKENNRIGEIHGANRQVIGIGSIHHTGIRYTLKGKNNTPWFWKFGSIKDLEFFLNQKGIFLGRSKQNPPK